MQKQMYYQNKVEKQSDFQVEICLDFFNERLRVDDYQGNLPSMFTYIDELVHQYSFTKVFVKSRKKDWQQFLSRGYMLEGIFKGYFNGEDAYSMAMYYSQERRKSAYWLEEDQLLKQVQSFEIKQDVPLDTERYTLRIATKKDALKLSQLYAHVFQTYPTPMDNHSYIEKMMEQGTLFYLIEDGDVLASAASADINAEYHNAEITDCATLPEYRKLGFMRKLILALEEELTKQEIYNAYSIARALSFGMNRVFFQLGYTYNGRLTNNCYIFDKIEDMNLWTKDLSASQK